MKELIIYVMKNVKTNLKMKNSNIIKDQDRTLNVPLDITNLLMDTLC